MKEKQVILGYPVIISILDLYLEVRSILEMLASAVYKGSLDNWLEIRTGKSPLWYWIPFHQDLPNFNSNWLGMSMPSWATSLVLQAEFSLAS